MQITFRSTLLVYAALAGALVAMPALAQPSGNTVNAPAPGSTESYSGSLAELATGVRSTPEQPSTIQSPRDVASGQATGAVQTNPPAAMRSMTEYVDNDEYVRSPTNPPNAPQLQTTNDPSPPALKLGDIKGEVVAQPPGDAASGLATGRRTFEPIMAGPGDGADGPPAQVQGKANSWLDGSFDVAGRNATNPNQGGAAGASAPGAAAANTANAIEVTNTDAGPPKPTAPTIGEPGTVKKNPSRRRPKTRRPGS